MNELINTYGFELKPIIEDARANGNGDFADLVSKQVENLQVCFDIIAQKHSVTEGNLWNIDANELATRLQ